MAQQLSAYKHLTDNPNCGKLHVEFDFGQEIVELRWVLDRAMNCMDPKDMPKWLVQLSTTVDVRLGIEPVNQIPERKD